MLAEQALGDGYAVIGSLLNKLHELQPHLRRLVDTWLIIPKEYIAELDSTQHDIWRRIVREGFLFKLLEASTGDAFRTLWNELAFQQTSPTGRTAIQRIGNWMTVRLFPSSSLTRKNITEGSDEESMYDEGEQEWHNVDYSDNKMYERALKQIHTIALEVANGNDRKATKFLMELIAEQRQCSTQEHTLKSLCNIAKRCADMFRSDFEKLCLEEALAIDQNDVWTLIQWGDHLKRIGLYDDAIDALNKAEALGQSVIATSNIADVWAERRDYEKAVEIYRSIPGWEQIESVRTALAGILRCQGKLDEATVEYDTILSHWTDSYRAIAGKAETEKRKGNLNEALKIYGSLVNNRTIKQHDKLYYRVAMCAILKQSNKLNDAYKIVDEIVRDAPFMMSARIQRGTILGLLGNESRGLSDIPKINLPPGVGAWTYQYYRGLLLLKLKRFGDAKRLLQKHFDSALLSDDEKGVLRLVQHSHFSMKKTTPMLRKFWNRLVLQRIVIQDIYVMFCNYILPLYSRTKNSYRRY